MFSRCLAFFSTSSRLNFISLFNSELPGIRYPFACIKCKDTPVRGKKNKQWGGNLNFCQNYRSKCSIFIKFIFFKGPLVMMRMLVLHTTMPVREVKGGYRKEPLEPHSVLYKPLSLTLCSWWRNLVFYSSILLLQSSCYSALQFGSEEKGLRWLRTWETPSGENHG